MVLHILSLGGKKFLTSKDATGFTPLFLAIENNNLQLVQEFLKIEPSSLYMKNVYGDFPINKAVSESSKNNLDIVEALTLHDKKVFNQQTNNNLTPLITALQHAKDIEVVKFLLDNGADANIEDSNGSNALFYATFMPNASLEVVQLLLQNIKNVNHCNKDGVTTIFGVASHEDNNKDAQMLEALLDAGADPCVQTASGINFIGYLITNKKDILLKTLLNYKNLPSTT